MISIDSSVNMMVGEEPVLKFQFVEEIRKFRRIIRIAQEQPTDGGGTVVCQHIINLHLMLFQLFQTVQHFFSGRNLFLPPAFSFGSECSVCGLCTTHHPERLSVDLIVLTSHQMVHGSTDVMYLPATVFFDRIVMII